MDNSPNQFRQPEEPTTAVTPPTGGGLTTDSPEIKAADRPTNPKGSQLNKLAPLISLILGLLLVTGGIVYGLREEAKTKPTLVALPDYLPNKEPATEGSSSALGTEQKPASPLESAKPSTNSQPAGQPTGQPVEKLTKTAIVAPQSLPKPKVVKLPQKPNPAVQSTLPKQAETSLLPEYQPTVVLADYQPQYIETIKVSLEVAGGPSYTVNVAPNSTVLAMMNELKKQGFNFKTQSFSFGEQIIEINGQGQSEGNYWLYALNGQCAKLGVSQQTLKEGDRVTFALNRC